MNAPARRRRYSYRDYLLLEQAANVKHEYLDGEIYGMAGGTPEHAAICANVTRLLGVQLGGRPCRVHSSDLRVRVLETGLATYPDVTVVCGRAELDPEDSNTVVNPAVIVEVLSPSTEDYDRGEKLEHYQQIPRIREILLVSHDQRLIEVISRGEGGLRTRHQARNGGRAAISSLDCELVVDDAYHDALTGGFLA